MVTSQITLIQIDNYGPWTVTPEPRPEADLQALQSRLYTNLSELIGVQGGYVFYTRFDNMVAVTNTLDMAAHKRLQSSIRNRYPVTVSFTIGTDPTPSHALGDASQLLQSAGSAQDSTRREVLRGETLHGDDDVQIAHFDVIDVTGQFTDQHNAFRVYQLINETYTALSRHMFETHGALTFFIGGDNIISVTPDLDRAAFSQAIDHVRTEVDVDLQVGVGRGTTASDAGMIAKDALEHSRETGIPVVLGAETEPQH